MQANFLLDSAAARKLYESVKDDPILDYHCHLSPKEIFEDRPFGNIGEMWLGGDHYKWRLMRQAGVPEEFVTGNAPWREKFQKYAETVETAAGNPLYHWTQMELSRFFGVETPLGADTAEEVWQAANRVIREKQLSPRKLMEQSGVVYVATTDDPADSLEYHARLRNDPTMKITVTPAFRTDSVLQLRGAGYPAYIARLSAAAGMAIGTLAELKEALRRRLDFFAENGCRFTDVGIADFPDRIGTDEEADAAFRAALCGEEVSGEALRAFLGNMDVFLGREYRERGLVMQMHLAVLRCVNSRLLADTGRDTGGDCAGDAIPGAEIAALLDAVDRTGGLPRTILYTLNPAMVPQLVTVAGSFRNVVCGAAWWFCDHRRGIAEQLRVIAEEGLLASFPGMLTDSRSFLSYARHDYYRRILCSVLGEWVEAGEYPAPLAEKTAKALCGENTRRLTEGV